jgi:hypothetical protein
MNRIWSKEMEVGDYWVRNDLLLLIGQPFQLVLEAIVGDGFAGDIAIDDISFTPGCIKGNVELPTATTPIPPTTSPNPCVANGQFMCIENQQCIDKEKVCDFKIDCPLPGGSDESECGTCTFDNNNGTLCGWRDLSFGTVQWNLATGATNLGPNNDHTTGNGFYVVVPTSNFYQFASLRTTAVGPSGFECQLKFWYYMNYDQNVDHNRISVYIRRQADNFTTFTFITSITDSSGPQWQPAVVNIGYRPERFAIGIQNKNFY